MAELSTKPYLLRAIYDWCTDAGFTPRRRRQDYSLLDEPALVA